MNILCTAITLLLTLSAPAATDIVGTLKVDPVELVYGKEVPGKESISATHYRFRYLFSSEENKAKFVKEPEKYEIQLGGACARMGPLSGTGRPDIYTAYKGRIYIFASESCKKTFLENPEAVLETPDLPPHGNKLEMRRGQALLYGVLTRMGGPERVAAVKNYQLQTTKKVEYKGKSINVIETITLEYPDKIRRDYVWGDKKYSTVVTKDAAWQRDPDGSYDLDPQQRAAAVRHYFGRNLLALLKARKDRGVRVFHSASPGIDYNGEHLPMEEVKVYAYGATCALGIDPGARKVLRMSYRGYGPDHKLGDVEKTYYDFQNINGIILPTRYTTRFNWKPVEEDQGTLSQKVDFDLPAGFFVKEKNQPNG